MSSATESATFEGNSPRVHKIVKAVQDLDLTNRTEWQNLVDLSSRTELDAIEVNPAGVMIDGDQFNGLVNVYVGLYYERNGKDTIATSDAFVGKFQGHFETDKPVVDRIEFPEMFLIE